MGAYQQSYSPTIRSHQHVHDWPNEDLGDYEAHRASN